jgi:hypothetical protein
MTPIVLKSKEDGAKLTPLADGNYKVTVVQTVDGKTVTGTLKVAVSKGMYTFEGKPAVSFDVFKEAVAGSTGADSAFRENTPVQQVTIEDDAPAAKDKTAGATPETPWLLYAGGALLLWLLLSKKN